MDFLIQDVCVALRQRWSDRVLAVTAALVLAAATPLFAAQGRIAGVVRTADGKPLEGAVVTMEGTAVSARTDATGAYVFEAVRPGQVVTLVASVRGLATERRNVEVAEGTTTADFTLRVATLRSNVPVESTLTMTGSPDDVGVIRLTPAQTAVLPRLGEQDAFRALQLLPAVSGANERLSGLYVSGGTPDQNLISFDGMTVYGADHVCGYFSAFNMDAVDEVRLARGAFEAKYGGRLSSVMEITGKTGDPQKASASAGVGLMSVHGAATMPLFTKGSLLIAGRRSFRSPLYDKILRLFKGQRHPMASYFYDADAKLAYELTRRDRLTASFYQGKDYLDQSFTTPPPSGFRMADDRHTDLSAWANSGLSVQWWRDWGRSVTSHLTFARSRYQYLLTMGGGPVDRPPTLMTQDNSVSDLTLRWDNMITAFKRHQLEFGAQVTSSDIRYDMRDNTASTNTPGYSYTFSDPLYSSMERLSAKGAVYAAYVQDRVGLLPWLTLTPGVRLSTFDRTHRTYAEPRLAVSLSASGKVRFMAAASRHFQFANCATFEDSLQSDRDFWLLSDGRDVPVSSAMNVIGGVHYESRGFLVDVEAFRKSLDGLTRLAPGDDETRAPFYHGTGSARGIELLVHKRLGRHAGWLSYTLSKVENRFAGLADDPFPANHDRRHEIKAVDSLRTGKWTFSGTWIFATGRPYTEVFGVQQIDGRAHLVVGGRNALRIPSYHRLDLAANYDVRLGLGRGTVGLTVFNVYNRVNVWERTYDFGDNGIEKYDVPLMGRAVNLFLNIGF